MKFLFKTEEIYHEGNYFPMKVVKNYLTKNHWDIVSKYIVHKSLAKDGAIHRKIAWDSVLFKMQKDKTLHEVLNKIIEDEGQEEAIG